MAYKFPLNIPGVPNVRVIKVHGKYQVQGRSVPSWNEALVGGPPLGNWVNAGGLHDTVSEALDFSEEYFEY